MRRTSQTVGECLGRGWLSGIGWRPGWWAEPFGTDSKEMVSEVSKERPISIGSVAACTEEDAVTWADVDTGAEDVGAETARELQGGLWDLLLSASLLEVIIIAKGERVTHHRSRTVLIRRTNMLQPNSKPYLSISQLGKIILGII